MEENMNVFELSTDEMEQVSGGRKRMVTAITDANVRSGPGTEFAVVGRTIAGFSATYTGEKKKDSQGRTWYRVKWNNKSGWICSKYVTKP